MLTWNLSIGIAYLKPVHGCCCWCDEVDAIGALYGLQPPQQFSCLPFAQEVGEHPDAWEEWAAAMVAMLQCSMCGGRNPLAASWHKPRRLHLGSLQMALAAPSQLCGCTENALRQAVGALRLGQSKEAPPRSMHHHHRRLNTLLTP